MSGKTKPKEYTLFAEDMSDEMLEEVVEIANEAFNMASIPASMKVFSALAFAIRARLDKEYDKGWNVVVGAQFGAYVTHQIKTYAYFTVARGVSVLVWRA